MNDEQEHDRKVIDAELAPCAVCGANVELIVDQTPEETPEGENEGSVAIIHPDGRPNCWNNNRYWGFGYKKGCRDEAIAEAIKQWNEHPDFDFFMGGDLSRRWRAGQERLRKVVRILEHYDHAREKHPHFCDKLVGDGLTRKGIDLDGLRTFNESRAAKNELQWVDILNEETWEVLDAIVSGDKAAAVDECYDAIAVLLRVVDVLEGRQPLGRPEGQGAAQ